MENKNKNSSSKASSAASAMPQLNTEAWMSSYRKNLEALGQANQVVLEVTKAITQMQKDFMRQSTQHASEMWKQLSVQGNQQRKSQASAAVQQAVQHATNHTKQVAKHLANTNAELFDVMNKRLNEGVLEAGNLFKKSA